MKARAAEKDLVDLLKNLDPSNLQAARSGVLSFLVRMPVSRQALGRSCRPLCKEIGMAEF